MFTFFGDIDLDEVPAPSSAESVERREAARLIYGALDHLREKYRTIFILFEIEGLSGEEIASLKGIRLATVWVRLNRARKQMSVRIRAMQGGDANGQR